MDIPASRPITFIRQIADEFQALTLIAATE
jgi:hypothetical protein